MRYYILTIFFPIFLFSQIGINNSAPLTTLHISSSDENNPSSTDGVIVPRVKSLNNTDNKPTGLLVFLDNEDNNTTEVEKGFYWWNGTSWTPFFSMNKLFKNMTTTYFSSLDEFKEGEITIDTSSNRRTIQFDASSLITNDNENFEINSEKELVIKKQGTYHIQAIVSIQSYSSGSQSRNSYEAYILLNGLEPTPNLRTSYGFPKGFIFDSNSVISGVLKINKGDRISIGVNRYYHDGRLLVLNPNGKLTNVTLTYMGDF